MTLPITVVDVESTIAHLSDAEPDRRHGERRGTAVPVIRFFDERRHGDDRRRRDRRGFARLPALVEVTIRHGGVTQRHLSADLSVLGTSLQGGPGLPVGALTRLSFTLPDDLVDFPITTWAQVVGRSREENLVRMRFVGLRACDARRMGRFLARHRRLAPSGRQAPYRF